MYFLFQCCHMWRFCEVIWRFYAPRKLSVVIWNSLFNWQYLKIFHWNLLKYIHILILILVLSHVRFWEAFWRSFILDHKSEGDYIQFVTTIQNIVLKSLRVCIIILMLSKVRFCEKVFWRFSTLYHKIEGG